jgi:serpin B
MRSNRYRLLLLCANVALVACGNDASKIDGPQIPAQPARALTADERVVASTTLAFGFDLLKQTQAGDAKPNLMISPLSASIALGMAANGANGNTGEMMRATLGYAGMTDAQMNAAYSGLIAQLRARDPKVEMTLANSVWYDMKFQVLPTFTDALRTNFEAGVAPLDFHAPSAPGTISKWAEDRTGGRIKNLITQIDPAEVMFLVNATYFKAKWTREFEKSATRNGDFTRADASKINVPLMSMNSVFKTMQDGKVTAVEMPYADTSYALVALMPTANAPLSSIDAYFTPTQWAALLASLQAKQIQLTLPKFKFDYSTTMNDALKRMGMDIAFDPNRADFSRIATGVQLYISRVQQKTYINLDEAGTEAAAATAVGIGLTSAPAPAPEVKFNKPFYFAIRERSTGTVLFIGRVGDPSAG